MRAGFARRLGHHRARSALTSSRRFMLVGAMDRVRAATWATRFRFVSVHAATNRAISMAAVRSPRSAEPDRQVPALPPDVLASDRPAELGWRFAPASSPPANASGRSARRIPHQRALTPGLMPALPARSRRRGFLATAATKGRSARAVTTM